MEIEEDYKEDGKYVGYYSITGDAGFAGTERTEYYRVRSDRRLDEKEVAATINDYLETMADDMDTEMYELAIVILTDQYEDYEEAASYAESYGTVSYNAVRDAATLEELKTLQVCWSEKVNDWLTIQNINY
jgi:hypothetical protein